MNKGYQLLFLFIFILNFSIHANEYALELIPENLKKNANAIVRLSDEEFIQQNQNTGVYKVTYVLTVLNEKGRKYADFLVYEDSYRRLRKMSGEVINNSGKVIKKISKKDLRSTSFSSHLFTDSKQTFFECYSPSYPFTIKYEYEIEHNNGILIYPAFMPVADFNLSLEKASYSIQVPEKIGLRYKTFSPFLNPEIISLGEVQQMKWSMNDFEALSYEIFAPFKELFPFVLFSPTMFCVNKYCGDMSTWNTFGVWQQSLLLGKDILPPKSQENIKKLTDNLSDKKEKVKCLYEYLQATTHYVSIQLGIGGWQPISAEEVSRTGFGDCKALSNYMKAMLSAIGIPSFYVVIGINNERFYEDYPSFSQADHVILMVPLENDSIWLECTSQMLPFGYIHSDIAGHDALIVNEDDSYFHTLPSYSPGLNKEINVINIQLDASGTAEMQVKSGFKMREYERMLYLHKNLTNNEQRDFFADLLKVHKPQVRNIKKEEIRSEYPQLNFQYDVICEDYASRTGTRMFIPVNPIKATFKGVFLASKRKFDIVLKSDLSQMDSICIQIPEDYIIESLPETVNLSTDFGSCRTEFVKRKDKIIYVQNIRIKSGRYPATKYEELKAFFSNIENIHNSKLSLKKID